MINRRKMFGFAAVLPLAAVSVSANNAPAIASTSTKSDTDAPNGGSIIQLQAQELMPVKSSNPYTISLQSYQSTGPKLGISVGKDGHMWLKIGEEWKRVVVE